MIVEVKVKTRSLLDFSLKVTTGMTLISTEFGKSWEVWGVLELFGHPVCLRTRKSTKNIFKTVIKLNLFNSNLYKFYLETINFWEKVISVKSV